MALVLMCWRPEAMLNTYYNLIKNEDQCFTNVGFYGADPMPWDAPLAPNVDLKCKTVLDWEIYY